MPIRRLLPQLFAFVLILSLPFAAQDDEIVKEFRKYFKKYKDGATRVEAVLALEGTESAAVVDALVPVLKDADAEVVNAAVRVLAAFDTRPPVDAMLLVIEEKKDEAIRVGLLRALAAGGYEETAEGLLPLLGDRSWAVRRRAISALAESKSDAVVAPIAALVTDKEPAVRCAVFDGLARLRAQAVVAPAIAALNDESWQVRSSAIGALRVVRSKDAVAPLIARMAVEEGRLVADIGAALENITARGFGTRIEQWRKFWASWEDRFEIPTDAELAKMRAAKKKNREMYKPPGAVTYHGIDTPSRSILFVIDQSGSMEQEVVEKDLFQDGDYPSFKRMDIVKTELLRTIQGLEGYVEFNILAFATDTKRWKKRQVKANVLNKSAAQTWIRKLESLGGSSKEELAAVGLVGSANLEAGRTNTYAALMNALEAGDPKGRGVRDKNYEVAIDTIFFLSDGRPSWGKFVDTEDILREVRLANELRKVVIHTIAIGKFEKGFMERLASDSGGVFVDLGE